MAAILAKKLGMTQRFLDDGKRRARDRARGRPMSGDRDPHARARRLRGRPARVRRVQGEGPDQGRARAPQEGRRLGSPPSSREFRDEAGELLVGETVTVEARSRSARRVKVSGKSEGQGLPGHDQAPQLRLGAEVATARTTSARRARSAPRPRRRACSRAFAGPGRMGGGRITQRGLTVVEVMGTRNLLLVRGAVPGPTRRRPWRCGPMARALAARSSAAARSTLDATRVRGELQHAAGARGRARRAERPPAGHRLDQDARTGLRRRRQAVAPEGHRPRARRILALAGVDRRRHRVRADAARTTPSRSTARRVARRCAARCRCTPSASRWRCSTRACSTAPSTAQAVDLLDDWERRTAPDARAARRRGRGGRRQVVPQPRARRRDAGRTTPGSPT